MTNDEIYSDYLTVRQQIENEFGIKQDEKALHYQTLLHLSYKTSGTRDIPGTILFIKIMALNDIVKKYVVH